jgi:spore maturation protein A
MHEIRNPQSETSPSEGKPIVLNHIWLALILLGCLLAIGKDAVDLTVNRFRNGQELVISLEFNPSFSEDLLRPTPIPVALSIDPQVFQKFYDRARTPGRPLRQRAELTPLRPGRGRLRIIPDAQTPAIWKEIQKAQNDPEALMAQVRWEPSRTPLGTAWLSFDPVRFVAVQAVTRDGILRYAKIAVELAIGLIGIMALWLGLMKIAEQSGLVSALARSLRSVMTRLFPDVPPDHPAMGAMIMNIAANMLGLGNAATPLGLKAMEELNRLNKKTGTATDAMCTFLVINTSNVQLIPATVIAIRAASGSANPTEIIGPVILVTTINTLVGIVTVKLLARWSFFKRQLDQTNSQNKRLRI